MYMYMYMYYVYADMLLFFLRGSADIKCQAQPPQEIHISRQPGVQQVQQPPDLERANSWAAVKELKLNHHNRNLSISIPIPIPISISISISPLKEPLKREPKVSY